MWRSFRMITILWKYNMHQTSDKNFSFTYRHNLKKYWKGPTEYHEDTQKQYFRVTFYCHWNIPDNAKINGPLLSTTLFPRVPQHVHRKHSNSSYTSILRYRPNTFYASLLLHNYECNLFHFIGTSILNDMYYFGDT